MSVKRENLIGQRFGFLIVVSESHKNKNSLWYWNCLCDCGNSCTIRHDTLKANKQANCGCQSGLLLSQSSIVPNGYANVSRLFRQYKKRGLQSGKGFSLVRDEFEKLIFGNCYYCDAALSNCIKIQHKGSVVELMYNGIDRLDSSQGYHLANCVSCCITCNIAKSSMSINNFILWIKKIYKHFIESANKDI